MQETIYYLISYVVWVDETPREGQLLLISHHKKKRADLELEALWLEHFINNKPFSIKDDQLIILTFEQLQELNAVAQSLKIEIPLPTIMWFK